PLSRSMPLTFPQVNVTSPYLGSSRFASSTCCFKSFSNLIQPLSTLVPQFVSVSRPSYTIACTACLASVCVCLLSHNLRCNETFFRYFTDPRSRRRCNETFFRYFTDSCSRRRCNETFFRYFVDSCSTGFCISWAGS